MTQIANSRNEVKREAAKMSDLLNGIHKDSGAWRADNPVANGVAAGQILAAREHG